jgi:hypothetical protein
MNIEIHQSSPYHSLVAALSSPLQPRLLAGERRDTFRLLGGTSTVGASSLILLSKISAIRIKARKEEETYDIPTKVF